MKQRKTTKGHEVKQPASSGPVPELVRLLPCPFCGEQPAELSRPWYGDYEVELKCPNPLCLMTVTTNLVVKRSMRKAYAAAAERWNARATEHFPEPLKGKGGQEQW